jgi:hypothetical protein
MKSHTVSWDFLGCAVPQRTHNSWAALDRFDKTFGSIEVVQEFVGVRSSDKGIFR